MTFRHKSTDIDQCRDWLRLFGLDVDQHGWHGGQGKRGSLVQSNGMWFATYWS